MLVSIGPANISGNTVSISILKQPHLRKYICVKLNALIRHIDFFQQLPERRYHKLFFALNYVNVVCAGFKHIGKLAVICAVCIVYIAAYHICNEISALRQLYGKKETALDRFFSRAVKGYFSALLLSNILGYLSFCKVGGTG